MRLPPARGYPSDGYFGAKGTLTGAYNYKDDALRLGAMGLEERLPESCYLRSR